MKSLGLYLHVPFCKSKCLYCDFCSAPHPTEAALEAYVAALCRDLLEKSALCGDYLVDTVYVGGGTPTVLSASQLEAIMEAVTAGYHLAEGAEITAECNPATANGELFRSMRRAGWNRLSIGVQSARERELKALGRLHRFSDFLETWELALAAGFSNLSADVMFGIPHQTAESLGDTLERILACKPQHLSAYALTVEEGTPFGRRGAEALDLPDEDTVAEMYEQLQGVTAAAGLERYEISNFARRGYESRHNLKYWNTEEYLGFGPGAHSDFGGVRFGNGRDIEGYVRGADICEERYEPDAVERVREAVMLGMRLREGISQKRLQERFGALAEPFARAFTPYVAGGFVKQTEEGYAFTTKGMLVSNSILSDILDFG